MANVNLLNINVDSLFEQHSVSDIDAINRKIQNELDTKKENLKVMVSKLIEFEALLNIILMRKV